MTEEELERLEKIARAATWMIEQPAHAILLKYDTGTTADMLRAAPLWKKLAAGARMLRDCTDYGQVLQERDALRVSLASMAEAEAAATERHVAQHAEIERLRGLLREAWPYVTEQYEHNVPEGPNEAAKLHDRIYCAMRDGVPSGAALSGKEPT